MIPGSLINAITSLLALALRETDHNFIHSTKPMQKIKGLGYFERPKIHFDQLMADCYNPLCGHYRE